MPSIHSTRSLVGARVGWESLQVGEIALEWVAPLPLDDFGDGAFEVRLFLDQRLVLQLDWPDLVHLWSAIDRIVDTRRKERRGLGDLDDEFPDPWYGPPAWADFDPPAAGWPGPSRPVEPRPARWGQPWTDQEDGDLAHAIAAGESLAAAAEQLGRTKAALEARLAKLGLPRPTIRPAGPAPADAPSEPALGAGGGPAAEAG